MIGLALAATAAAVTARQARCVYGEAALRDTILLMRPGNDVGSAGRMLLATRWLAARPTEDLLTTASIADELRQLAATERAVGTRVGAYAAVERRTLGPSSRL